MRQSKLNNALLTIKVGIENNVWSAKKKFTEIHEIAESLREV